MSKRWVVGMPDRAGHLQQGEDYPARVLAAILNGKPLPKKED